MAVLFAESISDIPFIESINISDNNLTDLGLGPMLNSIIRIKSLIDLNLSQNKIGSVAAAALFDYLSNEDCPLERLNISNADVDDFECQRYLSV